MVHHLDPYFSHQQSRWDFKYAMYKNHNNMLEKSFEWNSKHLSSNILSLI